MDTSQQHYLDAMGIDVWVETKNLPAPVQASVAASQQNTVNNLGWDELAQRVSDCQACGLHKIRTHVVFGVGNRNADLMFIGEAPGAQEDQKGEPFVGRAGQLLNSMLKAIGIQREDVFIANILKCRPPNNRDPMPEEVDLCTPFLVRQVALVKPKLIVALGRIASHFLLNTKTPLTRLRGQQFTFNSEEKTPLIVTFHPAYLLRSPLEKAKAFEDLCRIKKFLG